MVIKANRDVLYFGKTNNMLNRNLLMKRNAPQHNEHDQDRGYPCSLFERGVLTVEAAFCATAFFLAMFSLLYLFQLLFFQNQTEMELANALGQYESYGVKVGSLSTFLKSGVLISWDEKKEICYVKERQSIPFIGNKIFHVMQYQQMKFNTYEGESMIPPDVSATGYVYLAENGRVYHRSAECVYLNPSIQSALYSELTQKRNSSGGKYGLCRSCCKGYEFSDFSTVYITPYGDCFHRNKKCSGLKRTVRKIEASKVGGLPPCSKCGGK